MVYVRVLCGVRYVSMGLRQEEDIIQPMERMTSSGDHHEDCRVQVQVEHHEEIKCLNLAILYGVNGLVKMCEERLTHSGLWGSNHLVFIEPTQSRKVVQLEGVKIIFI